jgi:hypothetical protein
LICCILEFIQFSVCCFDEEETNMRGNHFQAVLKERTVQRTHTPVPTEELPEFKTQPTNIIGLQRFVGNKGVQSLLAQGRISRQGDMLGTSARPQAAPSIQRCSCGGACAACQGEAEELPVTADSANEVRRWWDDEETESESGDSGSSWVDDAADWVSDTASDAYDTASEAVGGGSGGQEDSGSWWAGDEEGEEYSESWVEDAAEEVDDWFEDEETEEETTEEGGSWWDELWSDEEESSEGEDSESSDWLPDWLPDWSSDEESEAEDLEAAQDLPDVSAECETAEGIGFGGARQLKLHGATVANYNHAKPLPEPFPSGVTVTTGKKGNDDVFSASGTFDAEFLASPSITLPSVPSGLTPCQEAAVQAFIAGPLTAHENEHKAAFKNNYDGTFTATVGVKDIKDTAANRKLAMTNPVNSEDQKRTATANAESKKLDPWKETVQGLDCK